MNRTEIYVTDLGDIPVSPWLKARIDANLAAGASRVNRRLWTYVFRKFVGIEPPSSFRV